MPTAMVFVAVGSTLAEAVGVVPFASVKVIDSVAAVDA